MPPPRKGLLVRGPEFLAENTSAIEAPAPETGWLFVRIGPVWFVPHRDFGVWLEILRRSHDHHVADERPEGVAAAGVIDVGCFGPDAAGGR